MLLHLIRFDCADLDAGDRASLERDLKRLAEIPIALSVQVRRDLVQPQLTVLATWFEGLNDLDQYMQHPVHREVAASLASVRAPMTKVDVELESPASRSS